MHRREELARRADFALRVTAAAGWPEPNARLLDAFSNTPRARFLPPGTPLDLVYADTTVRLGVAGLNNGQPSLHAACLAALTPRSGETAVHVGAGTGYYTAILARLVGPQGRVEAYEIEPSLAALARGNLSDLPQAQVHASARGALPPLPACDLIYVNCGVTSPDTSWLEALRPQGRMVFPLTGDDGSGLMLLLRRPESAAAAWPATVLMGVSFVPCIGLRDHGDAQAITEALKRGNDHGNAAAVCGYHHGVPGSPHRVWCAGKNWWLERALG
ncbi:MAG: protein-L-isoaspartate O-methyltransferase family protein [Terriglobales bacterium]